MCSYLAWFGRYRYYRRFTNYRLVTIRKQLDCTKILALAKGFGVIRFGLVDIAVIAIIGVMYITGWSPKQNS